MKYIKKIGVLFVLTCMAMASHGQGGSENWMPVPRSWSAVEDEHFELSKDFEIGIAGQTTDKLESYASWVLRRLDWQSGLIFSQASVAGENENPGLSIHISRPGEVKLGEDESYRLEIKSSGIQLHAVTDIGAMRGLETFIQMVKVMDGKYVIEGGVVEDSPRFPWRGLMIDVSRHFQPIDVIKRNIDGLAMVKMNVLHLHLVDDHGFRVESKVFPALHEKASEGQYFTQVQIQEIIQYAADKGIRVVPEFDIPGHASAFLTAFPEYGSAPGPYKLQNRSGIFDPTLDPTNEATYTFLDALFEEMAALFPDEYFHIGGDENEGKHWESNPEIQLFMKDNELKDTHELQNYMVLRVQQQLVALNKKMIGWDEILNDALPSSAVIHSWRGLNGLKTASEGGHQTILSNGFYIDLMRRASDHYLVDPLPESLNLDEEARKNVLGGEATMWSELVVPRTIDSRVWPRTAAIAERLWSPASVRDLDGMYRRLDVISFALERAGLTHVSSREALMRNLVGGTDIEAIKTLANVTEPLEGYSRNPGGHFYEFHNPFNRFADITLADAPDARTFSKLVSEYKLSEDALVGQEINDWLERWVANHTKIEALIQGNPSLEEVRSISENLMRSAQIGLEAFRKAALTDEEKSKWHEEAMGVLNAAEEQGARSELQVVRPIKWLVKHFTKQIVSIKAGEGVKIDGDLSDWDDASWGYYVPSHFRDWSDTCFFATKWDEKHLYFAFRVRNEQVQAVSTRHDQSGLWLDDGIEILIDGRNDGSIEWMKDDIAYHVNVNNIIFDEKGMLAPTVYDKSWNGNARSAVKVLGSKNNDENKDEGYVVEFAVSWNEIGVKSKKGLRLGVNLCVNDRDPVQGEYRYYDLMSLTEFHKPKGFSELILD